MAQDAPRRSRPLLDYVRGRMEERGVTEEMIQWVLANCHTQRPAGPRRGSKPAVIFVGEWEGRNLRVYVERGSDPRMIKTVAWED